MKLIGIGVNLSKIDAKRLYEGKSGKILNLTIAVNDEPDQYGNTVACWEQQTKDERDEKIKRNYLGNGKVLYEAQPSTQQNNYTPQDTDAPVGADDIPF